MRVSIIQVTPHPADGSQKNGKNPPTDNERRCKLGETTGLSNDKEYNKTPPFSQDLTEWRADWEICHPKKKYFHFTSAALSILTYNVTVFPSYSAPIYSHSSFTISKKSSCLLLVVCQHHSSNSSAPKYPWWTYHEQIITLINKI